jgi:arginine-tRNA-protein transferase
VILSLVERARERGLAHVYLGFWVPESAKMAYKARFQPLECFGPDGWRAGEPPTLKGAVDRGG